MHDTFELTLVTRGAEWVRLDDSPAQAARSVLIVIPPGTVHSSHTRQVGVEFHCLHLDARQAAPVLDELALDALGRPQTFLASPRVMAAFRSIASAEAPLAADTRSLSVLEAVGEQVAAVKRRAELPHRRRLQRVESFIREEPEASHTVASLAAIAGLSPFHFVRAFRQFFGRTPHQLVLDVRLERARELMRSDRTLTEIAHTVGFASSSRLTEAFTRRFGDPPSAWRRRQRAASSL